MTCVDHGKPFNGLIREQKLAVWSLLSTVFALLNWLEWPGRIRSVFLATSLPFCWFWSFVTSVDHGQPFNGLIKEQKQALWSLLSTVFALLNWLEWPGRIRSVLLATSLPFCWFSSFVTSVDHGQPFNGLIREQKLAVWSLLSTVFAWFNWLEWPGRIRSVLLATSLPFCWFSSFVTSVDHGQPFNGLIREQKLARWSVLSTVFALLNWLEWPGRIGSVFLTTSLPFCWFSSFVTSVDHGQPFNGLNREQKLVPWRLLSTVFALLNWLEWPGRICSVLLATSLPFCWFSSFVTSVEHGQPFNGLNRELKLAPCEVYCQQSLPC